LSEKLIQQVLEIEKQARTIHEAAISQAEQTPAKAEQDAQDIIEKSRLAAEEEARQMIAKAQAQEETGRILTQAEQNTRQIETNAAANFDRAVAYVLDQVIGKE
jgi:vacuolar-type H+-ATPase subunit H